jgi:hypothetical protein
MATWRCPNCSTLQMESGRCFLCDRSATSCGTCVNFRRSLVGGLGYCALDRRRSPLTGDERRDCWSGAAAELPGGLFAPLVISTPPQPERGLSELEPRPPVNGR